MPYSSEDTPNTLNPHHHNTCITHHPHPSATPPPPTDWSLTCCPWLCKRNDLRCTCSNSVKYQQQQRWQRQWHHGWRPGEKAMAAAIAGWDDYPLWCATPGTVPEGYGLSGTPVKSCTSTGSSSMAMLTTGEGGALHADSQHHCIHITLVLSKQQHCRCGDNNVPPQEVSQGRLWFWLVCVAPSLERACQAT